MVTADLGTTTMWLAIMAIVSVLEALLILAIGIGEFLMYRRTMALVNELESRQIAPLREKVEGILVDVKTVTARVNEQTERVLTDRRAYQRKSVFGERHLRGQTFFIGMDAGIPTYLPAARAKKLPMFRTFRFKMLAEAHYQEDQYEANATAFKPVALARVVR